MRKGSEKIQPQLQTKKRKRKTENNNHFRHERANNSTTWEFMCKNSIYALYLDYVRNFSCCVLINILPFSALWSGTNKNRDVSTGPLARRFARSLTLLTCSLAPDCLLRSHPPMCSLVRSLAHFAQSLVGKGMIRRQFCLRFFSYFRP